MDTTVIHVHQIVGHPICVDADDGTKVYEHIKIFLAEERTVCVSFQNIEMITSAFLNTAIGQLYGIFSEEDIKKLLSVKDMTATDAELLQRVVKTAKLYYSDPERMEKSIQAILGED